MGDNKFSAAHARFETEMDRYAAALAVDGCEHLFETGSAAPWFDNDKLVVSFSADFYEYDDEGNRNVKDLCFSVPAKKISIYDEWPTKRSQLESTIEFFEEALTELKSRREFYTSERDGEFFWEGY